MCIIFYWLSIVGIIITFFRNIRYIFANIFIPQQSYIRAHLIRILISIYCCTTRGCILKCMPRFVNNSLI